MTLEQELESDSWRDYAKAGRLIDLLRAANLRERCRTARERYNEAFAMDEARWSAWIQDELANKTTGTKRERHTRCDELFARAIEECGRTSVRLHMGRSRNAMELEADESDRRALYETATAGPGMNFNDGHLIWQAYRAFELSWAASETQKVRVKALYLRQLKIPQAQSQATLEAAKTWAADAGLHNADAAFHEAYAVGNAAKVLREPYEARLLTVTSSHEGDAKLLRAYATYIDFEMASGSPDRVVHLYERALSSLPYVAELWRDYVLYVWSISFKSAEAASRTLMLRAVRMCPSSVLWKSVLELESSYDLYTHALRTKFRDPNDYGAVLTKVLTQCVRLDDWAKASGCVTFGFEQMAKDYSPNIMAAAAIHVLKELVDYALMKDHKTTVASFIDAVFAQLAERAPFKTAAEFVILRTDTSRLIKKTQKEVLDLYDVALQRGTVEPVGLSKKTVDEETRRLAGTAMLLKAKARYLSTFAPKKYDDFNEKTNAMAAVRRYELKLACERLAANAAAKERMKSGGSRRERAAARRAGAEPIPRKRTREIPEGGDKTDMNLAGMDHDARVKTLFPTRDTQTAFVKNLSWDVTDAELMEFFTGAVSCRIVKDKATGRSRGIAYVDFGEEAALNAAIMRSGEALKGRLVDIAKSRPPGDDGPDGRGGRGGGRGSRGGGRGGGRAAPSVASGRGRGGLGLMPRAITVTRTDNGEGAQAKTNADFRAMFVKGSSQ
jgi:hypothetical protein